MYNNRLILFLALAIFFSSPVIINWYAAKEHTWYHPFLLWLIFVLINFWMVRNVDTHD